MTVSGVNTQQTPTGVNATPKTGVGADFNMFLKLLTAQMKHQDPMDPMKTSEYTQQLVQYAQVEQSTQQTKELKNILNQLYAQEMAGASAFIGREARFDSPVAGLGSAPANWTYALKTKPVSMVATIKDESGKVIAEKKIDPAEQGRFSWDGIKTDGTRAADGAYTLSIRALDAKGEAMPVTINSVATVKDVVSTGNGVMLGVNGIRMPLSGLVSVSAPPA